MLKCARFLLIPILIVKMTYKAGLKSEILFWDSTVSNIERLRFMVSLKEMWSPSKIRAEANNLEDRLFNTTRRLMRLERQYRLKKMEYLASIEAYEERLKWVTAEMEWKADGLLATDPHRQTRTKYNIMRLCRKPKLSTFNHEEHKGHEKGY